MSETLLIWLFGILGVWNVAHSLAIGKLMLAQVRTSIAMNLFIDTLGEKLAKVLHADDDHLNLDALLEKYLNRHYELSYDEWTLLKDRCNQIMNNKGVSQLERSLAGMLAGVCEHKLMVKFKEPIAPKNA